MKRIYFSLVTIAILLFSACNNDVPGNEKEVETGTLTATISFGMGTRSTENSTRAAQSNAIPTVSWSNVKQVQLFLYRADGTIAFSHILNPANAENPDATDGRIFTIPNVPLGDYNLALLANTNSSTDYVKTSFDAGTSWVEFNNTNVRGQDINNIIVDLAAKVLPIIPEAAEPDADWEGWNERVGYDKPSEIFTAFLENIKIEGGKTAEVTIPELKREISLLRTRFDIETVPPTEVENRAKVNFDTDRSFIVVQQLPEYFSLMSGISSDSDSKKVYVAATGTETYLDEDPTSGYKANDGSDNFKIIDGTFKRWNDFHIFPNVTGRTGTEITNKEYFIIIAAWVDLKPGDTYYTYADGTTTTLPQPVYWWALVDEAFTKNVIREVNLTLETAGYIEFPDEPTAQGGLKITIGAPEEWNSTIVNTDMKI